MDSGAIEPGKDSLAIGPVLPAEMVKRPYRPKAVGTIAFFFGPVAGALVSVINLRRYGYPLKATRVLQWTLLATILLAAVIVVTPDPFARILGLVAEFVFYKVYSGLQQKEFEQWQTANPGVEPLSGWGAIGWGLLGLFLFFVVVVLVGAVLGYFFPSLL